MRSFPVGANQENSNAGQRITGRIQGPSGIPNHFRQTPNYAGIFWLILLCVWFNQPNMARAASTSSEATAPANTRQEPASASTAAGENYPIPQAVLDAYPNEPERMAALVIMRDVIWAIDPRLPAPDDLSEGARNAARQLFGSASHAWRQQQGDAYNRAIKQVQAGEGLDGFTKAQTILIYHGGTGSGSDDHARDFHEQLFAKFLPPLLAGIKAEEGDIQAGGLRAVFGLAGLVVVALSGLIMLIVPWRYAGRGDQSRMGMAVGAADDKDPLALPENLQVVKVPRLEYPILLEYGQVIDEKTWSETHIQVSTSGGGSRVVGNQIIQDPIRHHTSSTVVQKDRVWLCNLNNEQSVRTFSGGDFLTRQGQILSFLLLPLPGGNHRTLLAYNHATGRSKLFASTLSYAHKLKGLPLWGMMMGIAAIGGCLSRLLLLHAIASPADIKNVNTAFIVWLALAAVLSLIYVGIIKLVYSEPSPGLLPFSRANHA
jgi:hypothetical protein